MSRPFLTYYRQQQQTQHDDRPYADQPAESRADLCTEYTRAQVDALARRAARCLSAHKLAASHTQLHAFSANRVEDLIFRLAARVLGTVPVTVNWQVDTPDRVLYKIELTRSRLCLIDEGTAEPLVDVLRAKEGLVVVNAEAALASHELVPTSNPLPVAPATPSLDADQMIIFTSGTTGHPKGVRLSRAAYKCNASTFDNFLFAGARADKALIAVVVNPLHHTNSTAICDWACRTPRAQIVLMERYSTRYWSVLSRAGTSGLCDSSSVEDVTAALARRAATSEVVAPLVSRHVDFLEELATSGRLPPRALDELRLAISYGTTLLLGSAPVGPSTIERLDRLIGAMPVVRFGSTETTLQLMGTQIDECAVKERRLRAFRRGWDHTHEGRPCVGYLVGRPHPPHTEARVVRSITRGEEHYLVDCKEGEPGLFIARGANVMSGYVGDEAATAKAIRDGWYVNLGDVGFWLTSADDGRQDFYWMSRESAMLIRGGANYSFEQVNEELGHFVQREYDLQSADYAIAVVGGRVASEHEDSCLCTLELIAQAARDKEARIRATFLETARRSVAKWARPDALRIAALPRNFKGAVKLPELAKAWALDARGDMAFHK